MFTQIKILVEFKALWASLETAAAAVAFSNVCIKPAFTFKVKTFLAIS